MDLASRSGLGWVLAVLVAGGGCSGGQEAPAQGGEHQARARSGYEAIAPRVDAAVEKMSTALADHPYRGGPYADHLEHPGVVAAAEIAEGLAKEVGARCLDASLVVGNDMLTFVENDCAFQARCQADAYEVPGLRAEWCEFLIDGKPLEGLGIEVTRSLAHAELRLRIRGPAA